MIVIGALAMAVFLVAGLADGWTSAPLEAWFTGRERPARAMTPSRPARLTTPVVPLRPVTPERPLRLLVTGDSMLEVVGADLRIATGNLARVQVMPHYSTGLVREDFYDWPAHAPDLVRQTSPDAIVFMIGGNDNQNIRLGDGTILMAGSPQWAAEYQRRAGVVMTELTGRGRRLLYWVGMPPPRDPSARAALRLADEADQRAAKGVPGVHYIDTWGEFSAPDGSYSQFVGGVNARQPDGMHFSFAGAKLLSTRLLSILDADWGVTGGHR